MLGRTLSIIEPYEDTDPWVAVELALKTPGAVVIASRYPGIPAEKVITLQEE